MCIGSTLYCRSLFWARWIYKRLLAHKFRRIQIDRHAYCSGGCVCWQSNFKDGEHHWIGSAQLGQSACLAQNNRCCTISTIYKLKQKWTNRNIQYSKYQNCRGGAVVGPKNNLKHDWWGRDNLPSRICTVFSTTDAFTIVGWQLSPHQRFVPTNVLLLVNTGLVLRPVKYFLKELQESEEDKEQVFKTQLSSNLISF